VEIKHKVGDVMENGSRAEKNPLFTEAGADMVVQRLT
jgi:hypothetical protein